MFNKDRAFVIAEAGTCHAFPISESRLGTALKYVDAAKLAGADAIKFQIFADPTPDSMFCWIDGDERRVQRWRDSFMTPDEWFKVRRAAEARGMMFLASVFEHETVGWLHHLGVKATKVASRAAKDFPYDKGVPPYLISLGMHEEEALPKISQEHYFLQCEANYPSTDWWIGGDYGFSDHSGSPWRAIDAIGRGCRLVEVHFYRGDCSPRIEAGPDYYASLTVDQLKLVCEARDAYAGR